MISLYYYHLILVYYSILILYCILILLYGARGPIFVFYIYGGVSSILYQGKWYRGPPVTYLQNRVLNNSRDYENYRLHNCNGMFQIYNLASLNNLQYQPTNLPTYQPTNLPTYRPTDLPTYQPTNIPTYHPSVYTKESLVYTQ